MSAWEAMGKSDDWYTPKYIFDALGCVFDLDPASGGLSVNVPTHRRYYSDGLEKVWHGFVWMNPPFGGRNGLEPWPEVRRDTGISRAVEHADSVEVR